MSTKKCELPETFTKDDNFKGKNIISFSSAGRNYVLGSDDKIKPIVINGPIEDLFNKLKKDPTESDHPDNERDYLKYLPGSFPSLCRLIQTQFPEVFIHIVRNQYPNGFNRSKIIISGRTVLKHNYNNKDMSYYPANETLFIKRFCKNDYEYFKITGMKPEEWSDSNIVPIVTQNYRMCNISKFNEDKVNKLNKYRDEVLKNGKEFIQNLEKPYQIICQWINASIEKVGGLEIEKKNQINNNLKKKYTTSNKRR